MANHARPSASAQEALGNLTIGEGYLLRAGGVAVALIDLTPPDLRLHDAASLERLLEHYAQVLRACPDRCSLLTTAVPSTSRRCSRPSLRPRPVPPTSAPTRFSAP